MVRSRRCLRCHVPRAMRRRARKAARNRRVPQSDALYQRAGRGAHAIFPAARIHRPPSVGPSPTGSPAPARFFLQLCGDSPISPSPDSPAPTCVRRRRRRAGRAGISRAVRVGAGASLRESHAPQAGYRGNSREVGPHRSGPSGSVDRADSRSFTPSSCFVRLSLRPTLGQRRRRAVTASWRSGSGITRPASDWNLPLTGLSLWARRS